MLIKQTNCQFINKNSFIDSKNLAIKLKKPSYINNFLKSFTTLESEQSKRPSMLMKKRLRTLQAEALIKGKPKVFSTVLKSICPDGIPLEQIDLAISEVTLQHNKMILNHSVVEGSARFGRIRLYAIQILEGQNVDSPSMVAVVRKNR